MVLPLTSFRFRLLSLLIAEILEGPVFNCRFALIPMLVFPEELRASVDPCDNSSDSGLGFDHHIDYHFDVRQNLAYLEQEVSTYLECLSTFQVNHMSAMWTSMATCHLGQYAHHFNIKVSRAWVTCKNIFFLTRTISLTVKISHGTTKN